MVLKTIKEQTHKTWHGHWFTLSIPLTFSYSWQVVHQIESNSNFYNGVVRFLTEDVFNMSETLESLMSVLGSGVCSS